MQSGSNQDKEKYEYSIRAFLNESKDLVSLAHLFNNNQLNASGNIHRDATITPGTIKNDILWLESLVSVGARALF